MDAAKFRDLKIRDMPEKAHDPRSIFSGHVYMIRPADTSINAVKVGLSLNPFARLESIQVSNWMRLELYAVIGIAGASAFHIEQLSHKVLAEHCKPLSGEWFETTGEFAMMAVLSLCMSIGCETLTASEGYWRVTQKKINQAIAWQKMRDYVDTPEYRKIAYELDEPDRIVKRRKLGID